MAGLAVLLTLSDLVCSNRTEGGLTASDLLRKKGVYQQTGPKGNAPRRPTGRNPLKKMKDIKGVRG